MKIQEKLWDDIVIIDLHGSLMLETADSLTEAVRRHLEAGRPRMVLNLAGVPTIDSCGLGALAQTLICARRRGGDVKLLYVAGRNLHLLGITKLSTVFETHESEEEAVQSFGRSEGHAVCGHDPSRIPKARL